MSQGQRSQLERVSTSQIWDDVISEIIKGSKNYRTKIHDPMHIDNKSTEVNKWGRRRVFPTVQVEMLSLGMPFSLGTFQYFCGSVLGLENHHFAIPLIKTGSRKPLNPGDIF